MISRVQFVMVAVFATAVQTRAASDVPSARFLAEYPTAAAALAADAREGGCEGTFEVIKTGKFKGMKAEKKLFFRGPSCISIEHYSDIGGEPATKTMVYCKTDAYFFQLERRDDSAPFIVKNIVKNLAEVTNGTTFIHYDFISKGAYAVGGIPVDQIITHPSFAIHRVTDSSASKDGSKVTVEFSTSDASHFILGGSMSFSPPLGWALVDFDVEVSGKFEGMTKGITEGARLRGSVTCRRWPDGAIFPTAGEFRFVRKVEPHGAEPIKSFVVSRFGKAPVSDDRFTLSQFGLPDSALLPPQRASTHFPYGLLLIAVCCAAAAAILRFAIGKRTTRKGTRMDGIAAR